jgi:hypothetical protein
MPKKKPKNERAELERALRCAYYKCEQIAINEPENAEEMLGVALKIASAYPDKTLSDEIKEAQKDGTFPRPIPEHEELHTDTSEWDLAFA